MSSPVSLKTQQKQRAHRKSSKPLMERRRRARINACLSQLHVLLAQARITQTCRRSRLEKADILEMTVRHLKSITSQNTDATLWSRFNSGYTDCAREVSRFLNMSGAGAHPWRTAFLQPAREKLSVTNTGTIDNLSFDHQLNSKWLLPTLRMAGVAEGPLRSVLNPACSQGLLPRVRSEHSTTKVTAPAAPSVMKTEHKPELGGIDVWRPW